jgi:hypothetical protein
MFQKRRLANFFLKFENGWLVKIVFCLLYTPFAVAAQSNM